jgi:hypothetical protein
MDHLLHKETMDTVTQKLAAIPESECRMEDILMEW